MYYAYWFIFGEIVVKKDLIFTPVLLLIGVLLFLLRATGMTVHIAVSVLGVLVLLTCKAAMNKKA